MCFTLLSKNFGSAWKVYRPTVELADGLQLMTEDLGVMSRGGEWGGVLNFDRLKPGLKMHVHKKRFHSHWP